MIQEEWNFVLAFLEPVFSRLLLPGATSFLSCSCLLLCFHPANVMREENPAIPTIEILELHPFSFSSWQYHFPSSLSTASLCC